MNNDTRINEAIELIRSEEFLKAVLTSTPDNAEVYFEKRNELINILLRNKED